MTLKYIKNEEYKNKIEKLYLESFPEEERFPFWILEAAPDYNQDKVSESSKEALLAAFKDITNYNKKKYSTC